MDTEVIVVGAGPTGLTLAGDLARAGVHCTLLERRTDEPNTTRAFAVHARTLEELDVRGLADDLVASGTTVPGVRLFGRAQIDLSRLPTRYPYLLVTPQYETERVLAEHTTGPYVTLVRGAELSSVTQDRDGVTAAVADGRTFRGSYLVGCDGVRSDVRSSLGLPFPGRSAVRSIMLADVRLREQPADVLTVDSTPGAFAFIAPFGDGWYRVFAWNGDDLPDSAPVDLEAVREATHRVLGTDYGMHDPRWLSRFHSDERQAPHYRVGRVFLAGDAAHCHSPAGGMGMNTGIQDAANLGWKLAMAVKGQAGEAILDTYESERHPVGELVLRTSGAIVRTAIVRTAMQRALRTTAARLALSLPAIRRRAALAISGIGIDYGDGADRVPDTPLRDGRRLYESLRDGRFTVLGQPALDTSPWDSRLNQATPATATDRVTLVRPDAYAAWSGPANDVAGLRQQLDRWCGRPENASTDSAQSAPCPGSC